MTDTPTLSVIMPVYNAAAFLPVMTDSILRQTFREFETVCVDDGSPDISGCMMDETAALDDRVTVIHRPNGGVFTARSAALELCRGKYIGFADSDDFVHPQMYEIMIRSLEEQNASVAWCRAELIRADEPLNEPTQLRYEDIPVRELTQETAYSRIALTSDKYMQPTSVWNHVFRADLLRDSWAPDQTEDFEIVTRATHRADKVLFIDEKLYVYIVRNGSLFHGRFNAYHWQALKIYFRNVDYIERYVSPALSPAYRALLHYSIIDYVASTRFLAHKGPYRKDVKRLTDQYVTRELMREFRHYNGVSAYKKITVWCEYYWPGTYSLLRKLIFKD